MKRSYYFIAALMLLFSSLQTISAKGISVDEAKTVAEKFQTTASVLKSRHSLPLKHVYTESVKGLECVYVFSRGTDNGYVIVAGDDSVQTPVLGYADNGSFDAQNMPENMKWWLGEYARQIEYLNQHSESAVVKPHAAEVTAMKEVAPILTCKWDQGDPYNRRCPEMNWRRCYVGCVATATAQVMYHHKYPEVGNGVKTYNWKTGNQTLTVDFSKYPLKWSDMQDVYTGNEPAEQCDAVATLSYLAGVMANMDYSPSGSGTYTDFVASALYKYFGYDDAMVNIHRDYFPVDEWDALIRKELDANRPVLYSGANTEIGHAFVLDGYNAAGYFHVNWGWSGMSNGYFRSTALDPQQQGAGGSNDGYNFGQLAVMGVQPETVETKHIFHVLQDGDFITRAGTAKKGNRVKFEFTRSVTTESVEEKEIFNIGVGFYNDKNELAYEFYYDQPFEIVAGTSYSGCFVSPVMPDLADGMYTVRPVYKSGEEKGMRIMSKVNNSSEIYMKVEGQNLTFTNQGPLFLDVKNVVKKGNLNQGSMFSITADFTNVSRGVYSGGLTALFFDETTGNIFQILGAEIATIAKDETVTVSFADQITVNPGKCSLALVNNEYNFLYQEEVTIGNALPAVPMAAELVSAPDVVKIYGMQDITFKLTNTSEYDFYDRIYSVFAVDNKVKQIFSEDVYEVPAGQSVDVTVRGVVNPNVVNRQVMFAVTNGEFQILASKDMNVVFSELPILYVDGQPELKGYSDYDLTAGMPVYDKAEINYFVRMRNLGAVLDGPVYLNLFKMEGDVPVMVLSDMITMKIEYGKFGEINHTFKDYKFENGQKYKCELYYGDNKTPVDEGKSAAYFMFADLNSSVESVEAVSVSVYPNPVEDVLNIVSPAAVKSVRIFNMQGARVMAAEGVSELNVSELRPATYIAVIVTEDGETATQKVIKK